MSDKRKNSLGLSWIHLDCWASDRSGESQFGSGCAKAQIDIPPHLATAKRQFPRTNPRGFSRWWRICRPPAHARRQDGRRRFCPTDENSWRPPIEWDADRPSSRFSATPRPRSPCCRAPHAQTRRTLPARDDRNHQPARWTNTRNRAAEKSCSIPELDCNRVPIQCERCGQTGIPAATGIEDQSLRRNSWR